MPIDMRLLASDWMAVFDSQRRRIGGLSAALQRWLDERLERMDVLERRTRAFPIFLFDGTALSVTIDAQQHRALAAHGSAGQAWAAPFVAFGRGFTRIPQAVEDEMILPNLIGAIQGVFALVQQSIDRLIEPRASTFNPRNARASDLFGLLAMAWRGLTTSTGHLRTIVGDIGAARDVFARPATPAGAAAGSPTTPGDAVSAAAAAPVAAETSSDQTLDMILRGFSAAVLILPIIPDWIGTLASAIWLRFRMMVVDALRRIETRVFGMRRQVLSFFFEKIPELLREVPALVAAMSTMLQWSINYFAVVARIYFEVAVFALNRFLTGLQQQVNDVIDIVNSVLNVIDAILGFDLLEIVKPFMGPSAMLIDLIGVKLTVNDVIEANTQAINFALWASLKTGINAARGVVMSTAISPANYLPWVGAPIRAIRARLLRDLGLIERIVDALFADTGGPMVETARPRIPRMPNFYNLLFGVAPGVLGAEVSGFGRALAANIRGLFENVSGTLSHLGEVFSRTAADFARTGPAGRMRQFAEESAGLANGMYEFQIRALGDRIEAAPIGAFERWLAGNGFRIIEAAIPMYIGEMRRWWRERAMAGEESYVELTPTSPHILARRARLGRVRVPRLTLRAHDRAHDEPLVRELAQRFRDAIGQAYADGRRQLDLLAAGAA